MKYTQRKINRALLTGIQFKMKNYVEGESQDHFKSYYGFARNHVQDKIYSMEKSTLLNSDIDQLTELVVQDYILPLVIIDSSTKPQVEDETSVGTRQILCLNRPNENFMKILF